MSADRAAIDTAESPAPAATTPSRTRKRPLRTYGRRPVQTRTQEQEALEVGRDQQSTTPDLQDAVPDLSPAESPVRNPLPKEKEEVGRPSRGSILAYFKPLPASPDKTSSDVGSSPPAETPLTPPPASPAPPSRSRKRRRLTTRPQFIGLEQQEEKRGEDALEADDASTVGVSHRSERSPSIDDTTIIVRTDSYDALRPALSEVTANQVDHHDVLRSVSATRKWRARRPTDKPSARDMTQTTLSLSVQKEPGFTICGVCDILYNPLNEKDRREHNRRHAAFSRNKKRTA